MKKLALHWKVIIGLVLGIVYAWISIKTSSRFDPELGEFVSTGDYTMNNFTMDYINPFGDIFINILKMIAVPLVLFSIIEGVASLKDIKKLGRIGIKTLGLYLVTTLTAVVVGLLIVNLYQPGSKVSEDLLLDNRIKYELWRNADDNIPVLDDLNYALAPENESRVARIQEEMSSETQNAWVKDKVKKRNDTKKSGPLQPLVDVFPKNIFGSLSAASPPMIQIIFFAIFFGIMLISIPEEKSKPVTNLVVGLNEVFVKMIWTVMKAMPIFVFALMAGQVVKAAGADPNKLMEYLQFLLHYSIVVVLGLGFMLFIFYPNLVNALVKKISIRKFMSSMRDAQITAFSTSSSVATLPVTMECVEKKLGVSERTTSFVLPIGATINMDGTSLYQGVAVVAMAQFHMVDLTLGQQAIIILTATLASIGAAAIPSAGLVLMMVVLESVGLNPLWIALIFPVDRILDMCRTSVNVTGDGAVSTIIANSENELN